MDSMGSNQRMRRSYDDTTEDLGDLINENPDKFIKKMFDPSFKLTTKQYCSIVKKLKYGCMHENVLEMWSNTQSANLTAKDIIEKLQTTYINRVTGHEMNFTTLLGGVEKDKNGHIVSAQSVLTNFNLHLNFSDVNLDRVGNAAGTESWTTVNIMRFEERYLLLMKRLREELENDDVKIYYAAGRSYGDISEKTLFQDIEKVVMGTFLMMIYMVVILSKYSWVDFRLLLTFFGVMNIGMAYLSGCGLSSIFFFYSPVHTSLFFIILGLGVDDIFVIMSAYRKISESLKESSLEEKIAKTMQKAGASITITSLTDIIAFLVGSFTILPSLRSFCVFGAMCILMTYIYVVTFFVAVLTIDEKRVEMNRNGVLPCIVHEDKTPSCDPKLMNKALNFLHGKIILTKWGKTFVILSVIAITSFSVYRVLLIKQKFDPMWFIPSRFYFYEYVMQHREFYPNRGFEAGVYFNNVNYTADLPRIITMTKEIEEQTDILANVEAWPVKFQEFMISLYDIDVMKRPLNDTEWRDYISKFLFSVDGGRYQANLRFSDKLVCGEPAPDVLISSITYQYYRFNDRDEFVPARKTIENIVKSLNFSREDVFVWGRVFANWYTDEIIDSEIYRNISLALIGVFLCTAVMIVNFQVCVYIFMCVLLSLISIGGFIEFWGLTLDIVTSIGLQLSVGLCIGETFMPFVFENLTTVTLDIC